MSMLRFLSSRKSYCASAMPEVRVVNSAVLGNSETDCVSVLVVVGFVVLMMSTRANA